MASPARKHPAHDPRRSSVRYSAQLQVRFGLQGHERVAPVDNMSEGGMCIKTNEVFPTGSRILIALDLPSGEVHLTGEVMWAIRVPEHQTEFMEHGMGVQFVDVGPEWSRAFARWQDGSA